MKRKIIILLSSIIFLILSIIVSTFLLLKYNTYYTITFVDYDDKVLDKFVCKYNDTPIYNKELPIRTNTNAVTYSFKSWDPLITPAKENITYKAEYDVSVTNHQVIFYNALNNVISDKEYPYNTPSSEIVVPSKPSKSNYVFQYWTLDLETHEEYIFDDSNKVLDSISLYPYYIKANYISYSGKGYTWDDLLSLHYIDIENNELISVDVSSLDKGKLIIPESITSIRKEAFKNQEVIVDLVIQGNIVTLEDETFYNCSSLKTITLQDSLEEIKDKVFYNCSSLENINLPSLVNIGKYAFYLCTSLKTLSLGENISSIGICAFNNCTSLKNISFDGSINYISESLFERCSSLERFIIPNTVKRIDPSAFKECSSLVSIELKTNITWIDFSAFSHCSSLEELIIPDATIRPNAFEYCTSLKKVTFTSSNIRSKLTDVFKGCSSLEELVLPFVGDYHQKTVSVDRNPIGAIFGEEYYDDSIELKQYNWVNDLTLTSYYLPSSLSKIEIIGDSSLPDYAFHNLNINTLILSKSITKYQSNAFKGAHISSFYFKGTKDEYLSINFENEDSKPHLVSDKFYVLNSSNEYEQVEIH